MSTLRVSFTWEDTGNDAYDQLIEGLTALGAWDIEEEPAPDPEPVERPKKNLK
jgi:hypothetical protein